MVYLTIETMLLLIKFKIDWGKVYGGIFSSSFQYREARAIAQLLMITGFQSGTNQCRMVKEIVCFLAFCSLGSAFPIMCPSNLIWFTSVWSLLDNVCVKINCVDSIFCTEHKQQISCKDTGSAFVVLCEIGWFLRLSEDKFSAALKFHLILDKLNKYGWQIIHDVFGTFLVLGAYYVLMIHTLLMF